MNHVVAMTYRKLLKKSLDEAEATNAQLAQAG
jgi:hypothetical protein